MEVQVNNRTLGDLICLISLIWQIHKWERELRRASKMCLITRTWTAQNRLEELYQEYNKLRQQMRKG